ncbi:MAG: NUDIX hydrolase [Bacteroidia bacterium]|nr:NUDIX hydrolase [Bacteroidia bacterium]
MTSMIPESRILWQHPLLQVEEKLNDQGEWRLVVHRGAFVAVCLHLYTDQGEEGFLMVRQQRPTAEEPFYEHPAGMIEPDESPSAAAIREVAEEVGWLLHPQDLILLHEKPLYPSPAFWGERGYFFAARLQVPQPVLTAYAGGVPRKFSDESLTLVLVPPERVLSVTQNLQTVAHTLLYYAYLGTPYRGVSPASL